jgi:hypothetical protein
VGISLVRFQADLVQPERGTYNTSIQLFQVIAMKINLEVIAAFDLDGNIQPKAIVWEDGRVFEIDRVLDVRRAASLKAGGLGIRYICRIRGKEVKLFNEEGRWFMEK